MRANVEGESGRGVMTRGRVTLRRWITANTFTPLWLAGRWPHPAVSYLAAALTELVSALVVVALVHAAPTFRFVEAPLLVAIVLVALMWGAGPGILATLVGVGLLDVLLLPPYFALSLSNEEDVSGVMLVLALGLLCSIVAGQSERRRRESYALAQSLAVERTRLAQAEQEATTRANELQAIFEAITDGVYVSDAQGDLLRLNAAGRALASGDASLDAKALSVVDLGTALTPRDARGQPLPLERWPVHRVLVGEVLTGAHTAEMVIRTLDGQEKQVSISGAPVRDAEGRIARSVTVVRDVTEQRRMERRTHEALEALLAMARTLVLAPELVDEDGRGAETTRVVGQRLVQLTRDVLGCQRVGITTIDTRTGIQRPVAVAGLSPAQEREWWVSVDGTPVNDSQTPTDPALASRFFAGEALVLDMTQPPFRDQPNPFGIRTFLVAPMRVGPTVIGILSLDYGGADHDYTPDERALAGAVAQLAVLTLERERLLRDREEARATELALREVNQRMDEFLSIASHELTGSVKSRCRGGMVSRW